MVTPILWSLSFFPLPKRSFQLRTVQLPEFPSLTAPTLPVFPSLQAPTLNWPALPQAVPWPAVVPAGWTPVGAEVDQYVVEHEETASVKVDAPASFAIAAVISLVFRLIGQLGLVFLVGTLSFSLAKLCFPSAIASCVPLQFTLALASAPLRAAVAAHQPTAVLAAAAAAWLGAEGAFYGACLAISGRMNSDPSFATPPLDAARRQELWTRILNDPTQTVRRFVETWFYVYEGPERVRHGSALSALWGYVCAKSGGLLTASSDPSGQATYDELRRSDVLHWLAGGLFERPLDALGAFEAAELDGLVRQLELKAGAPLPDDGLGWQQPCTPGIRAMSLALDPVQWLHRPLLCYALTHALYGEVMTPRAFRDAGFERRRTDKGMTYYVRGAGPGDGFETTRQLRQRLLEKGLERARERVGAAAEQVSERVASSGLPGAGTVAAAADQVSSAAAGADVVEPAASPSSTTTDLRGLPSTALSSRPAFVFIHGVGVGPGPYAGLLEQIALLGLEEGDAEAKAEGRDGADDGTLLAPSAETPLCIAVQVDQFAQRIAPGRPASPREFAAQFERLLDVHGVESAVVIGHSLGTAYASYLNRFASERVAAMTLIDPICCMLHHSRTSKAFVYRPVGPSVMVACEEYYVRRELFTSNVIARHFRWHEATLWPSDCTPATPLLIVLSEEDVIVPVEALRSCATTWNARARGVQVLSLPGLGHGGWLGDSAASGEIARRVRWLVRSRFALPRVQVPAVVKELPGMARTAAASAAADLARPAVPSLPKLPELPSLPSLPSTPPPPVFLTKERLAESVAKAGLPPTAAEQIWDSLTDAGGSGGVRVEVDDADGQDRFLP